MIFYIFFLPPTQDLYRQICRNQDMAKILSKEVTIYAGSCIWYLFCQNDQLDMILNGRRYLPVHIRANKSLFTSKPSSYRSSQKNWPFVFVCISGTKKRISKPFFSSEIHIYKFWIQNHFFCDIRGLRYLQNKIRFWNGQSHIRNYLKWT